MKFIFHSCLFLLFIYSANSCSEKKLSYSKISYTGIDSIIQYKYVIDEEKAATKDIEAINKFYFDGSGCCIKSISETRNRWGNYNLQQIEYYHSNPNIIHKEKVLEETEPNVFKTIEKTFGMPNSNEPEKQIQSVKTVIDYEGSEDVFEQTKEISLLSRGIMEESVVPALPLDSFPKRRYFESGNLIVRDQYFKDDDKKLYKEIIYKYDDYGNTLYETRKSKHYPYVYTFQNIDFYNNRMWKSRYIYKDKELLYKEVQDIYWAK